jgi:enterochelin esterase-like enzyme
MARAEEPQWATPAAEGPRLQHRTFASAAAGAAVSYHVYTPEAYDAEPARRFPVIYWLHGSGGGLPGVPELAKRFDAAMRDGKMPPALVVFPNGLPGGMWCDSKDGKTPVETIVIRELLPEVDRAFRTVASREGRVLDGFSMGGYGAARLGFKYASLFGALSLLGAGPLQPQLTDTPRVGPRGREQILAAVYGGDQDYFYAQSPWSLAERHAADVRGRTAIRQAIGDRDETCENNRKFHERLAALNIPHTFTVVPGVEHKPTALIDALGDAFWAFYRDALGGGQPTGLLYFASYRERDNLAPLANTNILGALLTVYWSEVEPREGTFDWSDFDRRAALWKAAGKKVAVRIMWCSSGSWPDPAAKHPTPQWVLDKGAVVAVTEKSRTEVPLAWDPVYRARAASFLRAAARKWDGDPDILFVDVTPGAETNPYRFRRTNALEPEFKARFEQTPASDGRRYSHALWLETVKRAVDEADAAFARTPLLVTLNVGSLDGPEQSRAIGDYCAARGFYVGQNGLTARSYLEESPRKRAFAEWGQATRLYFEMLDASGGGTGSLMEVVKAAERAGCSYLGVYAADVLRGTPGQPNYDPAFAEALAYGARALGRR